MLPRTKPRTQQSNIHLCTVHSLTSISAQFLCEWERTVVIVSHDRGFLNRVTTATIFIHRKRLWYYGGSYDTFLKVRAERRAHTEGIAKSQARRTSDLKSFIARFGHGHKKMARQAQSRMKLLERIQGDAVELDYDDPYLKLEFPAAQTLPPPCIRCVFVWVGCGGADTHDAM